ncbi:Gfo/Idh/MocA family protein [Actinoalloteichus hymeniacidonis]|uniref:Dehydrogenase n=1 Tax=Actinoalloteichus hymeniacidonis TaxID=340345 RepID=A0AAC9MZ18_9PSEU|nr:Gfo/Idh/MocA family oxidoreductase [Actinoalloteichus hymeniacidonis]AOS63900.1 putative dehydrogenase [Actinoalloteichus hymeniacidonis]MBB5908044.1 putative dehydrogenase [Actinoalloteichus hymeniacidonis]
MANSRRFRAAIIGTGGIAEVCHVPALRAEADRVELVAAVDVDPGRLADFLVRTDIPMGYASTAEMLRSQRPDLVHVCTPPAAHVDAVVAALESGAWVLLEKPPCRSLAEFDRITAAERPGGPYASVVYQHRFGSGARHAGELIASGELGRPLVALCQTTWYRGHEYFEVPWRGRWATEGGGPTLGHGIHQLDLLLALLGEWTEVGAMMGRLDRAVETEDVSVATVRFANGALASIVNSVLSPDEVSRLRIDLTEATVEVNHLYGHRNSDWRYTPAPSMVDPARLRRWSTPSTDVPSSHGAQLTLVLDAMERRERPPVSGRQGRETLELITALYRSALTGTTVRRDRLRQDDVFYHRLHGNMPGWAPANESRRDDW